MKKLICCLLLLMTVGCTTITNGRVIDKRFFAAHYQVTYMPNGKTLMPILMHHDDEWDLKLVKGDDSGWVEVSEKEYNSIRVGDNFSLHVDKENK